MAESVKQRLNLFLNALGTISPTRAQWNKFEGWIAGVRPYLRQHCPNHLADFNELAKRPRWIVSFAAMQHPGRDNQAEGQLRQANDMKVHDFRDRLLSFMRTLVELTSDEPPKPAARQPPPPADDSLGRMPFRPFLRGKTERINVAEVHTRATLAALQSGADEEELDAIGGRPAVLESIRRHLPDFDPSHAQTVYGPAWVRLKPILVRCGLQVDDSTTLTDIKGFLDASEPLGRTSTQASLSEKGRPVPDSKRVFIIYGRNKKAYDAMVKFLRALKLDPVPFNDVSAETGSSATVLQIVRRGMEKAAAVVALFTSDEWSVLRPALNPKHGTDEESCRWQARPNVIFEAGLALGLDEARTILVRVGKDVRLFSDVGGIHYVNLNNGHESRNLLRGKLKAAGCDLDMTTGNHLDTDQAGDFESCLKFEGEAPPADRFGAAVPPPAKLPRNRGKK
jgi:predicted nucleotide-binding protein